MKKSKDDQKKINPFGLTTNTYSDMMRARQLYRMTIAALAMAVLILAFLVQGKKSEIVVMPPDYYEPVIVDNEYANRSYKAGHALAIANLLGNVSPKNVDFVTEAFLRTLSPRLQSILANSLEVETKLLAKRRAKQTFEVEDVMFRNSDDLVWVWGSKTTTVGANSSRNYFTYEFRIQPNHGSPKITHFDSYPGKPNIRGQEPVEVTPYLSRELALVKQFSPGEITVTQPQEEVEQSIEAHTSAVTDLESSQDAGE